MVARSSGRGPRNLYRPRGSRGCGNAMELNFVFGYGSLLCDDSRTATVGAPHGCVLGRLSPRLGFRRAWNQAPQPTPF